MKETATNRLKRLQMRSSRRGIKEMDIILGAFSHAGLAALCEADIELYEDLLEENDHDIYQWVTGQNPTPEHYLDLLIKISAQAPNT